MAEAVLSAFDEAMLENMSTQVEKDAYMFGKASGQGEQYYVGEENGVKTFYGINHHGEEHKMNIMNVKQQNTFSKNYLHQKQYTFDAPQESIESAINKMREESAYYLGLTNELLKRQNEPINPMFQRTDETALRGIDRHAQAQLTIQEGIKEVRDQTRARQDKFEEGIKSQQLRQHQEDREDMKYQRARQDRLQDEQIRFQRDQESRNLNMQRDLEKMRQEIPIKVDYQNQLAEIQENQKQAEARREKMMKTLVFGTGFATAVGVPLLLSTFNVRGDKSKRDK